MNTKKIKAILALWVMVIIPCVLLFAGINACGRFNKSDSTQNKTKIEATNDESSFDEGSYDEMTSKVNDEITSMVDDFNSSMETVFNINGDDYRKACEKLDFGKAHEILGKLRDKFINKGLPKAKYCEVADIKGYQAYVDADIYIFREEATYLMGLDDPTAEKRILKLIMETPLDGRKLDEGPCGYEAAMESKGGETVWLYSYCIKRNNQKCDIVLDLSILNGNKTLAKKVLSCYKDNMHIESDSFYHTIKGKEVYVINGYIWYDSADKDAAQKKYNEAVKDGMFE